MICKKDSKKCLLVLSATALFISVSLEAMDSKVILNEVDSTCNAYTEGKDENGDTALHRAAFKGRCRSNYQR